MTHRNARLTPVTRAELVERCWLAGPRPKSNGKAEAFNKIMQAEWAYQRPYYSNRKRLDTLPRFLAYYNHRRPHGGIGGATPVSRL